MTMRLYSVSSGATAPAAAGTTKVAVTLVCGSTIDAKVKSLDVSFDGSTASLPILVELVTETAAPSGGSTSTPNAVNAQGGDVASITTGRINDTSDGGGTNTVLQSWEVPNTSGLSYIWPLDQEPFVKHSTWMAVRVTVPSTGTAPSHYLVDVVFEE